MSGRMSSSKIVKFTSLSQTQTRRDELNLIESEDGHDGEGIHGGRAQLEFRFPSTTTNGGANSDQSSEKTREAQQRWGKRQRCRIRAILIILAIILIITLLLVWHFYNLRHMLYIKDKYRTVATFNAETRLMSVKDKDGNTVAKFQLDAKGAVSGDLQHLHACQEPTVDSSCLYWSHKNTSLSITAVRFGDDDDFDKEHCIKVEWKMNADATPIDCVDLKMSSDDDVVWFGANSYITYPPTSAQNDACSEEMLHYIPGGFSVTDPFGTVLQNRGGSVIEPVWISSKGVVIKASTHHALMVNQQFCRNETNPKLCITSAPDKAHQDMHHKDHDAFHLDYMVCIGDTLQAAHQETIEHFIKPLMEPHEVPEFFKDMINDGAYFEGESENKIVGSLKPSDLPAHTLHSACDWLIEKPLWNLVIPDKDFGQQNIHNHLDAIKSIGGTVHLSDIVQVYDKIGDFVLRNDGDVSMGNFTSVARQFGFKIMLPLTPFVNYDTKHFKMAALNGYLIVDEDMSVPTLTRLQTTDGIIFPGVVDLTNPNASQWYIKEVREFNDTGPPVDVFHLYYGQASWIPNHYRLTNPLHNPGHFSTLYADVAYEIGRCSVSDVAYDSQIRHQFVLLSPSKTMESTVSAALAAGFVGYPFVIPTFPNQLREAVNHMTTSQIEDTLIRWIELVAFFPVMHIPWDFDALVKAGVNVSRIASVVQKYVDLRNGSIVHQLFEQAFLEAGTNSTKAVLSPMWMAPNALLMALGHDEKHKVLIIEDQFMIGNNLCVAPILFYGTTTRNVYLPPGKWRSVLTESNHVSQNGIWLKDYQADIDEIPVFVRVK